MVPWVIVASTYHPTHLHWTGLIIFDMVAGPAVTPIMGVMSGVVDFPWRRLPLLAVMGSLALVLVLYVWTNPTGPNSDPQGAPLGYGLALVAAFLGFSILLLVGTSIGTLSRFGYRALSRQRRLGPSSA
jgi:hypothetical protein